MRPTDPSRVRAVAVLAAFSALAVSLAGAGGLKKKPVEPAPPKVDEAVGDLTYIQAHAGTKLEGVGLVIGLENTGVDPPPSYYRQKLLDEMKKAGVENPNAWLSDPRVSMVIVRMTIPAGVSTTDRLDAEVELPPGSGTKSLAGGRLLECRLREVMVLGGVPKEGPEAATVQGPVMTGSVAEPEQPQGRPRPGRGPGPEGSPLPAHPQREPQERPGRQDGRDGRQPAVPADQGGRAERARRSPRPTSSSNSRCPRPTTTTRTDSSGSSSSCRWSTAPRSRAHRMAVWQRELLDPKTAGIAALRLEGLGVTAADALKSGLASPNAQVRFFAAEALAYLGDGSGAEELAQAAVSQPEFRAYALAALASTDQPAAHMKLRKLMDEPDVELRYGAFNALRTLAGDDPFLGQVRVLDDPKEPGRRGGHRLDGRGPHPRLDAEPPARPVRPLPGRLRRAADGPRRPDPALRGRDLRPRPEAADARRPRHRRRSC